MSLRITRIFAMGSTAMLLSCASARKAPLLERTVLPPPPEASAKQSAQSFERSSEEEMALIEDEEILEEPIPGRSVTVAWDPNPETENVDGYRVYVGEVVAADVEDTTAKIEGLEWGDSHSISVTAYNASGESEHSEPVKLEPPPLALGGNFGGSTATFDVLGWPGAILDLRGSVDLVNWVAEGEIILDRDGRGRHTALMVGPRKFWKVRHSN